ncbi:hypothetical protein B0T16DRAFT_138591 [Cercophora newfieldiana]|uniref:Uncharacterized protein n=1 Tax=Cercophora newfieldiana TaxID=92897 RepID=A0AA40CSS7_9PEZI|nr:hypothetical protein B0T16DRAFT_138591 [Cercophora newfieldiana]
MIPLTSTLATPDQERPRARRSLSPPGEGDNSRRPIAFDFQCISHHTLPATCKARIVCLCPPARDGWSWATRWWACSITGTATGPDVWQQRLLYVFGVPSTRSGLHVVKIFSSVAFSHQSFNFANRKPKPAGASASARKLGSPNRTAQVTSGTWRQLKSTDWPSSSGRQTPRASATQPGEGKHGLGAPCHATPARGEFGFVVITQLQEMEILEETVGILSTAVFWPWIFFFLGVRPGLWRGAGSLLKKKFSDPPRSLLELVRCRVARACAPTVKAQGWGRRGLTALPETWDGASKRRPNH